MQAPRLFSRGDIAIERQLTYDRHTVADTFSYKSEARRFQFDKMRERLFVLDSIQQSEARWGILQNRRNWRGQAPLVKRHVVDEYRSVADMWGVQRYQSVPLFVVGEYGVEQPERYGRDGSPVKLLGHNADSTAWRVEAFNAAGEWEVPHKYVKVIAPDSLGRVAFDRAVMVDRTNQVVATLERERQGLWLVRSMNPCTTGRNSPPVGYDTPLGMFVIQDRKSRMLFDNGGPAIVGFAPWASRFTNGAYLHGVPVNNVRGNIVEFSRTLGTVPLSHECVRNASSHAKFIYDWAPVERSVVFVYD
jgi:hypothetical protein